MPKPLQYLSIALLLLGAVQPGFTQSQTAIGEPASPTVFARVALVTGEASVTSDGQQFRSLARRDAIYEGDTVVTRADTVLHLRTVDSGMLSLRPSSELHIQSYHFEHSADDIVQLQLLRGTVRTISGELDGKAYTLELPSGSVSPESADFQVEIVTNTEQWLSVFNGSIQITTDDGELRLGTEANWDFAEIKQGSPPRGLSMMPGVSANTGTVLRLP